MKKQLSAILIICLLMTGCGSIYVTNSSSVSSVQTEQTAEAASVSAQPEVTGTAETAEEGAAPAYLKERSGLYYLNGLLQGNEIMTASDIAEVESFGMKMLLTLRPDGTGMMVVFGEDQTFLWDDQTLTFAENEKTGYTWSQEGGLLFSYKGTSYIFSGKRASVIAKAEKEAKKKARAAKAQEESSTKGEAGSREGSGSASDGSETIREGQTAEGAASKCAQIEIVGADWVTQEESLCFCVWYDFTNLTDGYLSPYAFTAQAEQDGIIFEDREDLADEEIAETGSRYMPISPGAKNRSVFFFGTDPEGGSITVTVTDSDTGEVLAQETFDSESPAGSPERDFVPEAVEEIELPESIEAEGVYDEVYELAIGTSETLEADDFGRKRLRVRFTFTNHSEETVSPFTVLYLRAVQDGLSLNPGEPSSQDPEMMRIYEEVEPEESAQFCLEWYLVSESPVLVEAYDWFSEETVLGRVFK